MCRSSFEQPSLWFSARLFFWLSASPLKAMSAPALPWIHDGSRLVSVASSQIGVSDGEKYWRWCGFDHEVDWCACFVSWCAGQCQRWIPSYTLPAPNLNNGSGAGTGFTAQTSPSSRYGRFFDNDGNSRPDHMGILSSYSDEAYPSSRETVRACAPENTYSSHDKRIISYGAFLIPIL